MIIRLAFLQATLAIALAAPATAHAQFYNGATYIALGPAAALQDAGHVDGDLDRRDQTGVGGAIAVGRYASPHLTYEGRLGYNHFARPIVIIPPSGCFGQQPCPPVTPTSVDAATLGVDAQLAQSHTTASPLVLAGAGLRYVSDGYSAATQWRPYAEVGAGLNLPFGAIALSVDGRFQVAPTSAEYPRWIAPLTLMLRF